MDLLNVSAVSKQAGEVLVLDQVSIMQQKNRRIAVAGETGSGKSTLLKIIGGLVQPDSGEVFFENVRVKGPDEKLIPGHPGIAYLSQQFELANNYRVEEVLQYANELSEEDADTIFKVCRIDHLVKRRTNHVSGGEKQRIAVARLLISKPKLFLLDEPYSNLDMIHKNILRSVLYDIGKKLEITCMLVSHDPIDTLSWADEIIVLKAGRIVQKDTAEKIYRQPVNEYVAGLFGKYNLLSLSPTGALHIMDENKTNGKHLFIRPEDLKIVDEANALAGGIVSQVIFLGSCFEIEIQLPGYLVTVKTGESHINPGDKVYVAPHPERQWYI